jgi:TonB family protein
VFSGLVYQDLATTRNQLDTLKVRFEMQVEKLSDISGNLSDSVSKQAYEKLNDEMISAVSQGEELQREILQLSDQNDSLIDKETELTAKLNNGNAIIRELRRQIVSLEKRNLTDSESTSTQSSGAVNTSEIGLDTIADNVVVIQSGYVAPELIARVSPMYPRRALQKGKEGICNLQFVVLASGRADVSDISCSSTGVGFETSSSRALESFRYAPATMNGVPVRSESQSITFSFDLD